jgi:hypothetical protein
MTIQRHAEMVFPNDVRNVSRMIRDILARDRAYRHTGEQEDGMLFTTTVKPHWWVLGTGMAIRLSLQSEGTKITVEIKPQPWTSGDVFGFYPRYMRSFLAAVAKAGETTSERDIDKETDTEPKT